VGAIQLKANAWFNGVFLGPDFGMAPFFHLKLLKQSKTTTKKKRTL